MYYPSNIGKYLSKVKFFRSWSSFKIHPLSSIFKAPAKMKFLFLIGVFSFTATVLAESEYYGLAEFSNETESNLIAIVKLESNIRRERQVDPNLDPSHQVFQVRVEPPSNSQLGLRDFHTTHTQVSLDPMAQSGHGPSPHYQEMKSGGEEGSNFHSEMHTSSSTYQIHPEFTTSSSSYPSSGYPPSMVMTGSDGSVHRLNRDKPIVIMCQAFAKAEAGGNTDEDSSSGGHHSSNSGKGQGQPQSQPQPPPPHQAMHANSVPNRPTSFPSSPSWDMDQNGINQQPQQQPPHQVSFAMTSGQTFPEVARVPILHLVHQMGSSKSHVQYSTGNGIQHEESSFFRPTSG